MLQSQRTRPNIAPLLTQGATRDTFNNNDEDALRKAWRVEVKQIFNTTDTGEVILDVLADGRWRTAQDIKTAAAGRVCGKAIGSAARRLMRMGLVVSDSFADTKVYALSKNGSAGHATRAKGTAV